MKTFKDLSLSPALCAAIDEMGFNEPTPIQAETLPLLLEGPTDFLGLAATGTGKTAAFGIPLLEGLNNSRKDLQALVLCPTRELALQVTQQLNLLGKHKKIKAVPVYGGAGYGDQIRGLRQGAQIVVATPGRLIDHLDRGTISLEKVKTVILDEADEMISMGFKDDLESILERAPAGEFNTWLFSATMSRDVRRVADKFLKEPKVVQANRSEMLSGTVRQVYYKVREADKADILCKLIDMEEGFYGLIFCQTKALVMDLTTLLNSRGYKVDCLHGDKSQNERERTMRAFKERKVTILVCTDVASRGIDVKDLTHVINYSIPRELDNYVHRIGRTGRSGKNGVALSLVTQSHMTLVGRIERMTKVKMEVGVVPTRKDVGMKKVSKLLERFTGVDNFQRVEALLSHEWMTSLEGMSKPEIASRLLALSFPEAFGEREKSQSLVAAPVRPIRVMEGRIEDAQEVSAEPVSVKPLESPIERTERKAPWGDRGEKPAGPRWRRERPEGSSEGFAERRPREGFGERRPREAFGERKPRRFGDRPERSSFGDRPERTSSFGDRKPRRFGDRPERASSFGDRKPSRFGGGERKPSRFKAR